MKKQADIKFIKEIASDQGIEINDEQAKRAHKVVMDDIMDGIMPMEDYYYRMKEYFYC